MKKFPIIILGLFAWAGSSFATLTVAASLTDLASIASYVGGERVNAFAIARSTNDPHSVEVLPSYMVKVSRANIYFKVGLSLDQWADGIVDGARNSKLRVVDCSQNVPVLEKPGRTDASLSALGDVHPQGNPHYWLNPDNGALVAQTIAEALTAADPAGASVYAANLAKFQAEESALMATWKSAAADLPNHNIITYHSSWAYFAAVFGFNIVSKVEPLPGIPPTPGHLAELLDVIKSQQVKVIIKEPYFSDEAPDYLARATGVKILNLSPSCSGVAAASYFDHFRQIFDALKTVAG
jgi:zinc/manganese transport system substrate-binding protein